MLPFPSSSSSSMSSSRFCFNRECSESKLQHYRPGWRLRTGGFAELCDRCASAYEQGNFCDVFHLRASGWRCCESCGKQIHCGCIVSASAFMLLDAGGIECLACARKKVALGPNFFPPPSSLFSSPGAEKFNDLSINWCSSTGSNKISRRPPSLLGPSVPQFDLHNRGDSYEFCQPTFKDRATAEPTEQNKGMNNWMGKFMSENSKNHSSYINNNQKAGPNCKIPPCLNVNVYNPWNSLKEGPCGTQLDLPVPITTPIETNGHSRLDESNIQQTPNSSTPSCLHNDLNGGADSLFKSWSQNYKTRLDMPGKYQVVPRYCPSSYNNQALQNQPKESKPVATPLFEKMLSVSDTGKVGRLVLPKKFAEAFFPQLSHPEGVPLKIEDSNGKEWIFQFRFWVKSRMYVLEGVAPYIQSMQLQAGDTVIFSRLDPEGKLIMGFRKTSVAQSSDQETGSTNNNHDTCTNGDDEPIDKNLPSKHKKSEETPGVECSLRKKKSNTMIVRGKRQKVEKSDHNELKLTWEEAQGFILPPPNATPSIVMIDEYEFEEYEDEPIIGKPTGTSCSADEEVVVNEGDEEAMKEPKETTKHPRHRIGCTCIVCIQSPSGKGPKHDQCCSCTVCETVKRRKHSLLLRREKKQIEKEVNAHKELESLNSNEELHQSANNSMNHENRAFLSKRQIDLNFQPEKDEESLPDSNTTSSKPPSSSSVKED